MNRAFHSVATMCRVLDVSPSGYYAWRQRAPSARGIRDRELSAAIGASHRASRRTYGRPRIHADLADVWRQLLWPVALPHPNCYRTAVIAAEIMLPAYSPG